MENTQGTVQVLNDLVQINNDRIEGYKRALKELKEDGTDLRSTFTRLIDQSHQNKVELGTEIEVLGKDIDNSTTTSGTIHRTWLEVKAAFTGHDTHDILEECEFGEDAILKAYESALDEDYIPAFLRELITKQQGELFAAHDEIKALRDRVQ